MNLDTEPISSEIWSVISLIILYIMLIEILLTFHFLFEKFIFTFEKYYILTWIKI